MAQNRVATPEEVLMLRQASENHNLNAGMMGWYVAVPPDVELDGLAAAISTAIAGSEEFSVRFEGDPRDLRRVVGPKPVLELLALDELSDAELSALARHVAGQTLDAFSGPSINAVLMRNGRAAWLAVGINHLLIDGDGFELFLSRVEAAYSEALHSQTPAKELLWATEADHGRYNGSRGPLPFAEHFRVGDDELGIAVSDLDQIARICGGSRFTVTLAFWADVVCRATNRGSLRMAVPLATIDVSEDVPDVGNWSWIPTLELKQAGSVRERVQAAKGSLAEAFSRYESSAGELAREMDTTLGDVEFAWFIDMPTLKLGGLELASEQISPTSLKAPLMSWAELDGDILTFRCFVPDPAGRADAVSRASLSAAAAGAWKDWQAVLGQGAGRAGAGV
ncbi:hypothetical protein KGQ19_27250 [Catenulispora sp. NL8]|uniref:Condensation domain-containing protein n=1 Tax=Catenulispora pinistramenti TaxID=2705254 RepID=A0ABS5KX70_9ACTN|nr:hypothetical protein [Catenulispora pinistramenti]MBS2550574.1 hypothetical protein [Catenulispora pinistramenti]